MHGLQVSVIIPCYNSSKYIRKSIESVLNQDYNDIEIITIDDGSTDNTKDILKEYLPKIRLISHDNGVNLGQYPSLNLGIKNATSDLIAFLDHDDLWYPGKIKKQVEVFEKNPDITLVYSNGFAIDERDRKLFKLLPDDFQEKNRIGNILLNNYTTPSAVMTRKHIFEKVGLFKHYLPSCGDHDMWIRISEIGKFYYLQDCLFGYRRHPGQLSNRTERRMWNDGFIILKDACHRYPYGENIKRKRLAVLYYRLGEHDFKRQKYAQSFLYFLLAGLLDPVRSLKYVKDSVVKSFLNFAE